MSDWKMPRGTDVDAGIGGIIQVVVTKRGRAPQDLTYFRGAPVEVTRFSSSDPFGDSTAELSFPNITPFDDIYTGSEFVAWFSDTSDVDLWWIPATVVAEGSESGLYINPLSGLQNLKIDYNSPNIIKLWEGFFVSHQFGNTGLSVQCQGALFQADGYTQKPFFPPRPLPLEDLLTTVWDHTYRPHLRTAPLAIEFPTGWDIIGPQFGGGNTIYTPNIQPGRKWTGYSSRSTGAWDRSVTGFAQDTISVMITQDESGVRPGDQWTVMQIRENSAHTVRGRQPVLRVRSRNRTPDFSVWIGTPGVEISLSRDMTQFSNVLYAEGTSTDGTVWRNAVISADGSRTDYAPLAFSPAVYPATVSNPNYDPSAFVRESYVKYGSGFDQITAAKTANKALVRDMDPGWSGSLDIKIDPSSTFPKWAIQAGMTVNLLGFLGTGEVGMKFHIAEVSCDVKSGQVSLKIDTRYRDLLSLEEALARNRDSLTPSKLLQVNRASANVEDIQAPWDYTAGSGYIPRSSLQGYNAIPQGTAFPYLDWIQNHPPSQYPNWYVACNSGATSRASRWAGPVPILMSEKGTIRRIEVMCVDEDGELVQDKFHCSLYYVNVTPSAMPQDASGPSPFIAGAFETINPATGQEWPAGNFLAPDQSMIIGWGNYQQPAGYSPGRYTDATAATGMLIDESTWSFDCTSNPNYNKLASFQTESSITIYAMFYSEHPGTVYFTGRLFKQPEGV